MELGLFLQLKHLHDDFTVQHLIDQLNLIFRLFLLLILKKNMESNGDKAFILDLVNGHQGHQEPRGRPGLDRMTAVGRWQWVGGGGKGVTQRDEVGDDKRPVRYTDKAT